LGVARGRKLYTTIREAPVKHKALIGQRKTRISFSLFEMKNQPQIAGAVSID